MMRPRMSCCALLLMLSIACPISPARAVEPDELMSDATQEQRARHLSAELRCLVCQNQSIDESDAALARDLRKLVRQHILAGESDETVRAFLVERYGEFVLLRPAVNTHTWLLWSMPFLALFGGTLFAIRSSRRRAVGSQDIVPLTLEERSRIDALLDHDRG